MWKTSADLLATAKFPVKFSQWRFGFHQAMAGNGPGLLKIVLEEHESDIGSGPNQPVK